MKKSTVGILLAIVSISLIAGIYFANNKDDKTTSGSMSMSSSQTKTSTSDNSNDSQDIKSGTVAVTIQDFDFHPMTLKVKVGTKVTWTNKDSARHDIAPDMDSPDFVGSGDLLAKGQSYSYTFEKAGTFRYHCTPHPYMKASVEVVE